jgi:hypothetical protein
VGRGTVGVYVDRRKSPEKTGRACGDRGKLGNYTGTEAILAYRVAICRTSRAPDFRNLQWYNLLAKTHTLLGERIAESVAQATDPANLIWVMPAKGK